MPLTTWLLSRDLRRAVARRRLRALLASHTAAFDALKAQVGLALIPVLRDMLTVVRRAADRLTTPE